MHTDPKCTCGHTGLCTVCVLESYEQDPHSRNVDPLLRHDAPEPNVIPMRKASELRSLTVDDFPRMNCGGLNSEQTAYEQHRIQTELK